jgi:hypothetical protein
LITFFLLNEESLGAIEAGRSALDFKNKMGSYRVVSSEVPESAVAFDESYIRNLYAANRLEISEPIRYGSWSGRRDFLSFQDIVMGAAPPAHNKEL